MSEMWTDDSAYEPLAEPAYESDLSGAIADLEAATADLEAATAALDPSAGIGWEQPAVTWSPEPWAQAPTCCGCDEPGWAEQAVAAVPAEPQGLSSVVVTETLPAQPWESWDQVAADPGATTVTVGGPIDSYAAGYTAVAADGSVMDPALVYPSVVTIGGQSLEPQFTVVQPPLEPAPPTGSMLIGGNTFGDITITDSAGNPTTAQDLLGGSMIIGGNTTPAFTILDSAGNPTTAQALLGGSMIIGGPSAGIGVGSNPMGGFMALYEAAVRQGNRAAQAAALTMMNSYNHTIDVTLAPPGTRWETRYEPLL